MQTVISHPPASCIAARGDLHADADGPHSLTHNTIMSGPWLSLAEAASYVGVNPRSLRRWVAQGRLRGYHVGKLLRFRHDDLDRLMEPLDAVTVEDQPLDAFINAQAALRRSAS